MVARAAIMVTEAFITPSINSFTTMCALFWVHGIRLYHFDNKLIEKSVSKVFVDIEKDYLCSPFFSRELIENRDEKNISAFE